MKKLKVVFALLFTFVGLGTVAEASLPVCSLGGPTAVNPDRQLADDETFVVTDRDLVVNLRFRPTKEFPLRAGECILPAGKEVAVKNGRLIWVKECGNDELNQNILVGPLRDYVRGLQGVKGDPGKDGLDGKDGRDGENATSCCENNKEEKNGPSWTKRIFIATGGVAVVGYLAYNKFKNKGPGVTTGPAKPICTGKGCPPSSVGFSCGYPMNM